MSVTLEEIKTLTGITGDYQDSNIQAWMYETEAFLVDAGVKAANITAGLIARGVLDLWNYGAGDGKFSEYFIQRAIQLSYKQ